MVTKKLSHLVVLLLMVFALGLGPAALSQTESPDESSPAAEASPVASPALYLRVGQRYPLEGVLAQKASISPENIASVHQTEEGVLIIGKAPGSGTLALEVSGKPVRIQVVVRGSEAAAAPKTPWDRALGELRALPGLHVTRMGAKTVVQGEVLGRAAYQKVLLHLRNYPANLIVLANAGPGIKASLTEQAHSLLAARGLKEVRVANAGNRFFLEGAVTSPSEVDQAFETVQAVLPNAENHLAIPIRVDPTISFRVFMLEVSRQAHLALGLSWPASTQGAFLFNPKMVIFDPTWIVTLQHLSSEGQARVLAEPMLAVKAGSQAELTAGGEIPIRITGHFENKVVWKHYGLKIRVLVSGIAGQHIRTKIETESSQLDEATAVDGVPGLRSTGLNTEVDAVEGQPILLTGLFHSEAAKDVDKVPLIGNIPLLGELFKSRRFRDRESELLVALLPTFGAQSTTLPLRSLRGLEFDKRWRPLD